MAGPTFGGPDERFYRCGNRRNRHCAMHYAAGISMGILEGSAVMNNFEDLQEMAGDAAHKKQHKAFWLLLFSYPLMMLGLGMVVCGVMLVALAWIGWGMPGGIAAFLAMLTIPVFYREFRFVIKGE